jgi:GNAT superfamily N-acetyltransferase
MLIKLRLDFLNELNENLADKDKATIISHLREYIPNHNENGFLAYLAESENGAVMGAAFLAIAERPAGPPCMTGRVGTLFNVFTYPQYRKKGVATALLARLIEEAKARNLSYIDLSASESGKPIYEKLGFKEKKPRFTEMKLKLV